MAYRAALRISRNQQCSTYGRVNIGSALFSEQLPTLTQERRYHQGSQGNNGQEDSQGKWNQFHTIAAGLGVASVAAAVGLPSQELKAEESSEKKTREKESRIRRTQTLDRIFDYFSTYRYINKRGKNVNLMSTKDFYNSVTPGSSLTHGTGLISEADYTKVTDADIHSDALFLRCEVPVPNSVLNKIQKQGLLTYTDFCFLMNILATPLRYLDIAFLAFDITGDGEIEAKEFLKVMTKITKHTGGLGRYDDCGTPEELLNTDYSALMNYFFGKDRKKTMKKDTFKKFRTQLIDECLWLEFSRYCKQLPALPNLPNQHKIITDKEFCEHLLAHANLPPKKKEHMIKRVTKFYGESSTSPTQMSEGITYYMFKSFYHVLFCGADLERALAFQDAEKAGVDRAEFIDLAKSISDVEVDEHLVDIMFLLLDEDQDGRLSVEEFAPLLAEWRLSRAFMQASTAGASIIDIRLSPY